MGQRVRVEFYVALTGRFCVLGFVFPARWAGLRYVGLSGRFLPPRWGFGVGVLMVCFPRLALCLLVAISIQARWACGIRSTTLRTSFAV